MTSIAQRVAAEFMARTAAPRRSGPDAIYVTPQAFEKVTGVPPVETIELVRVDARKPHGCTGEGSRVPGHLRDLGRVDEREYKKLLSLSAVAGPEPEREPPPHVSGGTKVEVDRDATIKIRGKARNGVVGTFKTSVPLYRIFDGEELARIVATGKIVGGMFSTAEERQHGASWGSDRGAIISWGNALRGRRLGDELFLAEIDGRGKRFYHMNAPVEFDPNGPPLQTSSFDLTLCNTGLGCSVVDANARDATFFRVDPSGKTDRLSDSEAKEYAAAKPRKDIDLKALAPHYHVGALYGVDVLVRQWQSDDMYKDTWQIETRQGEIVVRGASSMRIALSKAAPLLKNSHIPHEPVDLLSKARRKEWEIVEKYRKQRMQDGW